MTTQEHSAIIYNNDNITSAIVRLERQEKLVIIYNNNITSGIV